VVIGDPLAAKRRETICDVENVDPGFATARREAAFRCRMRRPRIPAKRALQSGGNDERKFARWLEFSQKVPRY